jgi:trehalose utilization protein
MSRTPIHVTVWGENVHERHNERVRAIYPHGMHRTIADAIASHLGADITVGTATLEEPEHGLTDGALQTTDVLSWWGHAAHDRVDDAVVERVHRRVLGGMGLLLLHSSQGSKILARLLGTSGAVQWRDAGEREVVRTVSPGHPIAEGVPHPFVIPQQEMYGEFFDIPQPDELVFISSFAGGEVFRSGCCFTRGRGRIFYFSPGHEFYPVYHQAEVQRVLANAVRWAAPGEPRQRSPFQSEKKPMGWFTEPLAAAPEA